MILISSLSFAISSSLTPRSLFIFSKFLGETSSNIFRSSQFLFSPAFARASIISCSILKTSSFNWFCEDSLAWRSFCKLSSCSPSLRTRASCSLSEPFFSSSSFKSSEHWSWADWADAALASAVFLVATSCALRSSNSFRYCIMITYMVWVNDTQATIQNSFTFEFMQINNHS